MKLKGIVFDLDGTLVDSLAVTFDAFNHGFINQGGTRRTPSEIMSYFGPGERQIFAAILGDSRADAAYLACRNYLDQNLHRVPLHAGISDLLQSLSEAGIAISVVTGRSWNTTEVILGHHGLLQSFVTVVANDHVSMPKPDPEGIQLACKRMGLNPAEILYVGDMAVDIQAARAAGSGSVAAFWDPSVKREDLLAHAPNHWAHHPIEISKICKSLLTEKR
ncbi:HAD-IA family hydrolase [Bdellovibrionota bacterium FG-1]